jgi:hypothetical protein
LIVSLVRARLGTGLRRNVVGNSAAHLLGGKFFEAGFGGARKSIPQGRAVTQQARSRTGLRIGAEDAGVKGVIEVRDSLIKLLNACRVTPKDFAASVTANPSGSRHSSFTISPG